MKSSNRHTVIATIGLFAVLGCLLWVAESKATTGVLQKPNLTATPKIAGWSSRPLAGTIYVNVFAGWRWLPQRFTGACWITYTGKGLFVRVHQPNCQRRGRHPIYVRYVSLGGVKRFTLLLSRHSLYE